MRFLVVSNACNGAMRISYVIKNTPRMSHTSFDLEVRKDWKNELLSCKPPLSGEACLARPL